MNAPSADTTSATAQPPRTGDIRPALRPLWIVSVVGLALAASLHAVAGRPEPGPTRRPPQPPRVIGGAEADEKTAKASVAEATVESAALPIFPADRRDAGAKATVATAATASPEASKQAPTTEKRLFSFQAVDLDLKAALSLFAKANNLNIVPDREVTGLVTVDLHELPLQQVMRAMLEAYDYWWVEEEGLIRVRATQTRQFSINYLRLIRKGTGQTSATLSSGSGASAGGGGGGGGGASGGGGGGGASSGGGGASGGGGGGASGGGSTSSSVSLTADNPVDFWTELKTELGKVLTDAGRTSMAVNMTAGMLMITDRPGALKRAEMYLKNLERTVVRQVEIEARLYSVTLNDQFQFGVDWNQAVKMYGNTMSIGSLPASLNQPIGGTALPGTGTGITPGGGGTTIGNIPNSIKSTGGAGVNDSAANLSFNNANTAVLVRALQEQGSVKVISKPRVRTLNNQTALIKVGTEKPYFRQASTLISNSTGTTQTTGDEVTFVTIGTILSLTPQVSEEGWITLDVSPVLSSLIGDVRSPSGTTVAPQLDIKQVSTIVRVRDGSTVVIGGLIQNEEGKVNRKIPFFGDIPLLGRLFQGQFDSKNRNELVIFITPRVVSGEGETEGATGR